MRAILILLCLTLTVCVSNAQSSSKKKKKRPVNAEKRTSSLERHASSLEPYTPYAERSTTSRKKTAKQRDKNIAKASDPVQEFYARMAEVQKKREQSEKMMEKPQYSDPMYFGHRRPPKKRSPEKMKYCRECGIKH